MLHDAIEPYNLNPEEEKKLILREYKGLLDMLRPRMKTADKKIIRRAFEIAAEAHQHTRRKSGEPYILHPIAVAKIAVEEIGLGVRSAIASLLHDTVEDTEITLEDIKMEFGIEIMTIIDGLTKISHVEETQNTTQQAENFRKVLVTLVDDPRVVLIKIADRLHNMRTMQSMKPDKQLKISSETSYIYAPLAHRLGLYEIHSELQDLSLKYTEPEIFTELTQKLIASKKERDTFIKDFIQPLKEILEDEGIKFEIYGRAKSISSIYNKIKTKQVLFEEIYDIFAIRIIVDSEAISNEKPDCWRVYSIIGNLYRPGQGRLRDWLTEPKGNGYEALHNTFIGPGGRFVEVQIRSKRMNEIAEKGIAAHWKYKESFDKKNNKDGLKKETESKLEDFLKHIREMLVNLDTNSIEAIQDLKEELFKEEMYVYTPKGDMRVLALGATALDFAFDIHSDIGRRCIGAKVNYKLVPISYVLKNGDQIEILTSSKQKPTESWLKIVITGKAKSRIRYYLKEEKRKVAEDGKYILEKKLANNNIPNTLQNVQEIAQYYKIASPLDLYYQLAVKALEIKDFKPFKLHGDKLEIIQEKKINVKTLHDELEHAQTLPSKGYELILFGENANNIKYKLANCCSPINGDDVFGFVSNSEGLKIHRTNCPNAAELMANYANRIVKAKWAPNKQISFLTVLRITGLDDVGMINKITTVISSEHKINMRSMSIESKDGVFEGTFTVFVHNKLELNQLCNSLEDIPGIQQVHRMQVDDE